MKEHYAGPERRRKNLVPWIALGVTFFSMFTGAVITVVTSINSAENMKVDFQKHCTKQEITETKQMDRDAILLDKLNDIQINIAVIKARIPMKGIEYRNPDVAR